MKIRFAGSGMMVTLAASCVLMLCGQALAGDDWTFHDPNNISVLKIYRTDRHGKDIGGPVTTYLPYYGCDNLSYPLGAVIRDYRAVRAKASRTSSIDSGFIGGGQGELEHIEPAVAMTMLGRTSIRFPFIETSSPGTIYVAVDLMAWVQGGGYEGFDTSNPLAVSVEGGASADLPGYVIGTEPLTFSVDTGWNNPSPYWGGVVQVAEMTVVHDEEQAPVKQWAFGALVLLGVGGGTLLFRRSRIRP